MNNIHSHGTSIEVDGMAPWKMMEPSTKQEAFHSEQRLYL